MKCHIKAQLIKVLVYFTYSLEKNFNGLHRFLALARGLLALLQCLDCLLKDLAESEHPVLSLKKVPMMLREGFKKKEKKNSGIFALVEKK